MSVGSKILLGVFLVSAVAVGAGLAWYFAPPEEEPGIVPEWQPAGTAASFEGAPVLGTVPPFELTDQSGNSFGRQELDGKVWVANFIFTTCRGTCPAQSGRMAKLQERLSREPSWDGIRLVSFTVDPEHDVPTVLQEYAKGYQADPDHWKFLTGEREEIWDLCKTGFKLQVAPNPDDTAMPILHDSTVVLVDRLGRIRGYYDALSDDGGRRLVQGIGQVLPEFQPSGSARAELPADASHLAQPPEILDLEWLDTLAQQQSKEIADSAVFHDFGFVDQIDATGITFEPQIVDEQRWRLQVNHYDHGTGICVADVDDDGNLDVYFLSQAGANALWRNRGDGTFENITDQAGVGLADRISVTASFADIDNDGDADLYVTTVRDGNALFLNDGRGVFEDVSAGSGLDYRGHSSAPVFFDYDNDGWLDVYLCNVGAYTTNELVTVREDSTATHRAADVKYYTGIKDAFGGHLKPEYVERSRLFRNEDGRQFRDVTDEVGLKNDLWSGDATSIDVNEDGWIDLYVLNMQGLDRYYENQQGEHFVDKTAEYFPHSSWGAMGVNALDLENDGDFDLLVTDMHSDMSEDIGPERERLKSRMQWPESFLASEDRAIFGNSLFRKNENNGFEEISDRFGAENYWPWGVSVADLNADGFLDVFVASSMCFPYRYGINSVWLNDHGQAFRSAEFALGIEPRREGQRLEPWFELKCEAIDRDNPVCAGRQGKLIVWSCRGTRSSVVFDLDGDGDLDILTNEFNSSPMALLSDLSDGDSLSWLQIKPRGTRSNRDGLGSIVRVSLPSGAVLTQRHDGKSGYLSQSRMPLYFGLDEAAEATAIDVQWPSGIRQHVAGPIEAGQTVTVTEPESN